MMGAGLAFLLAKMGVFVVMGTTADYDALFNGMNHEGCSCGKTYNVCANETCPIVDEKGSAEWDWEAWEKETTSPFETLNPISIATIIGSRIFSVRIGQFLLSVPVVRVDRTPRYRWRRHSHHTRSAFHCRDASAFKNGRTGTQE